MSDVGDERDSRSGPGRQLPGWTDTWCMLHGKAMRGRPSRQHRLEARCSRVVAAIVVATVVVAVVDEVWLSLVHVTAVLGTAPFLFAWMREARRGGRAEASRPAEHS